MLKISEIKKHTKTSVETDEYVPFTVIFAESDAPLYWRCGDNKSSLMEIGLNSETGSVESVTLTAIKAEHVFLSNTKERFDKAGYPVKKGIPLCDLSLWNTTDSEKFENNFYDSGKPLKLRFYDDSVLVSKKNNFPKIFK